MNTLRSIFARREAGILVMIVLFCLAVGIARPRFLTLDEARIILLLVPLILIGAFGSTMEHARTLTVIGATGVILSAVYMLWLFQRVNYGPLTNEKNKGLRDLSVREWIVIAPICAMAIFMGVVPNVFLKPMEPAVRFIEEFECTDEERHALCHGNAERIFHIAPE